MKISANTDVVLPLRDPAQAAAQQLQAAAVKREVEAPAIDTKKPAVDVAQAHVALAEINHALQMSAIGVRFESNDATDKMVIKVVDAVSGDLIRQMPSEEMLRISKSLDSLQGLLVNKAV